jgi:steroid 5-alpha reductase family enzyme
MALLAFGGVQSATAAVAAAMSPLFVAVLLTRVSGVPLLERAAEKRWGNEPAYRAYVARTRVLF